MFLKVLMIRYSTVFNVMQTCHFPLKCTSTGIPHRPELMDAANSKIKALAKFVCWCWMVTVPFSHWRKMQCFTNKLVWRSFPVHTWVPVIFAYVMSVFRASIHFRLPFVSFCSVDSWTIPLKLNLFALLKVFTSSKLVSKAKLKMKLQLKGEGEEARSVFISWFRHPLFWIWIQFFARCGSWFWSGSRSPKT